MPDITMCTGKGCNKTNTCYRFLAKPSMRQSYFIESPIKDGECGCYWKIE